MFNKDSNKNSITFYIWNVFLGFIEEMKLMNFFVLIEEMLQVLSDQCRGWRGWNGVRWCCSQCVSRQGKAAGLLHRENSTTQPYRGEHSHFNWVGIFYIGTIIFKIKYPNNCTCLVRTHEQKLEQLLLTTLMSLPLPVFFL